MHDLTVRYCYAKIIGAGAKSIIGHMKRKKAPRHISMSTTLDLMQLSGVLYGDDRQNFAEGGILSGIAVNFRVDEKK